MGPVPAVPTAPVAAQMGFPMVSPAPTNTEKKKKTTEQHVKQKYYQISKVKAGLQRIKDLKGEVKALVDDKINLSLLEATAQARMEELKATANQMAETLTSRVHRYESFR
jgi:hypothetical protein